MAKPSARHVLEQIAASGQAMSALEQVVIEEARPPKTHPYEQGNPLRGTLVMGDDGTPEDPGSPGLTLADMVRDIVGGTDG